MKIEWKACFRIGISVFLLYLCITYWTIFTSFAGAVIAFTALIPVAGAYIGAAVGAGCRNCRWRCYGNCRYAD